MAERFPATETKETAHRKLPASVKSSQTPEKLIRIKSDTRKSWPETQQASQKQSSRKAANFQMFAAKEAEIHKRKKQETVGKQTGLPRSVASWKPARAIKEKPLKI